jgi:hypothetical protein
MVNTKEDGERNALEKHFIYIRDGGSSNNFVARTWVDEVEKTPLNSTRMTRSVQIFACRTVTSP